jgi:hypothetical protein
VAAPESSAGRRDPELQDTWQHWSPPQRGGGVQRCGTHGGSGALSGEVRSGAAGHVVAPKPSLVGRWGPELRDMYHHRSPPERGGWVQSSGTRGSMWYHVMLLVLALCLYVRVLGLQGTDNDSVIFVISSVIFEISSPIFEISSAIFMI